MSAASAGVIAALGGGITAGGEPRPATVARAVRAAALYRSGRAQRIVMSGARGMYDPAPPRAEATAMAQIAAAAGVPPGSITAEPGLGHDRQHLVHQAAAGRPGRAARHRGDLRLACGARTVPNAGDLGTRLPGGYGASDRAGGHPAVGGDRTLGGGAARGRWFAGIRPGDDAAILARDHPVYADHPQITLDELAAMIAGHPRDRR